MDEISTDEPKAFTGARQPILKTSAAYLPPLFPETVSLVSLYRNVRHGQEVSHVSYGDYQKRCSRKRWKGLRFYGLATCRKILQSQPAKNARQLYDIQELFQRNGPDLVRQCKKYFSHSEPHRNTWVPITLSQPAFREGKAA
jgi:hypothetical protein